MILTEDRAGLAEKKTLNSLQSSKSAQGGLQSRTAAPIGSLGVIKDVFRYIENA